MANSAMKYFNPALRQFDPQITADVWDWFTSTFPEEDIVSLGSGTGLFEHGLKAVPPERRWTLIDRDPMTYNAGGLEEPFERPDYATTDAYLTVKPDAVDNVIALINWPEPNKETPDEQEPYDLEFVRRVQPRALLIIWEFRDHGKVKGEEAAGSRELHNYLRFPRGKAEYVLMGDIFEVGRGHDLYPEFGNPQYHMQVWKRHDVDVVGQDPFPQHELWRQKCLDAVVGPMRGPVRLNQDLGAASRGNEKLIDFQHRCYQEMLQSLADAGKRHQAQMEDFVSSRRWAMDQAIWCGMVRGEDNVRESSRTVQRIDYDDFDGDELKDFVFTVQGLDYDGDEFELTKGTVSRGLFLS